MDTNQASADVSKADRTHGADVFAPQPDVHGRIEAHPHDSRADELLETCKPHRMPPGDWPAARSVPVSVLVPVKNEESNIVACLRHLLWASELIVVDSQSSDDTIPLAQAMGASVYQFYYTKYATNGWPKKRNWSLENLPWKNEWVLIMDADEHVTPTLACEIRDVVAGKRTPLRAGTGDAYWINRQFHFMGRWIKHCGYYPSWNIRLLKHWAGRYERIDNVGDTGSGDNEVHEHIMLREGEAGELENDFLHYAYPSISVWVEKHNRYSSWEAHVMEGSRTDPSRGSHADEHFAKKRRLKALVHKLPFRPTLRFLYHYVLKQGFRDGRQGYYMCRLLQWYEFLSVAKYYELVWKREPDENFPDRH